MMWRKMKFFTLSEIQYKNIPNINPEILSPKVKGNSWLSTFFLALACDTAHHTSLFSSPYLHIRETMFPCACTLRIGATRYLARGSSVSLNRLNDGHHFALRLKSRGDGMCGDMELLEVHGRLNKW